MPIDRPNLLLIDPTASKWQSYTAPALLGPLHGVITTPSTVAVDAACASRPAAVFGHNLGLPLYDPLPILRTAADWVTYIDGLRDPATFLARNEAFLSKSLVPGCADYRILNCIEERIAATMRTKELVRLRRELP